MLKTGLLKGALAAAAIAGAMAITTAPASAYVACNRWHECWQTHTRYEYAPGLRIVVHEDAWRRNHARGYHWRADHDDRGYWRHGEWHRW